MAIYRLDFAIQVVITWFKEQMQQSRKVSKPNMEVMPSAHSCTMASAWKLAQK